VNDTSKLGGLINKHVRRELIILSWTPSSPKKRKHRRRNISKEVIESKFLNRLRLAEHTLECHENMKIPNCRTEEEEKVSPGPFYLAIQNHSTVFH
jgi:hypothetical protein